MGTTGRPDDALARRIVSGDEEDDAETVEAVFAAARDAEAVSEEYLVDDDWKVVEVEPKAALVNHIGAETVGTVVGNSEAVDTQRSLFSWTEFLAGEQGRSHSRKPKPASTSLFEWALGLEREEELVVAGR